ncbi:MAG: type II toxin-antitoxin system prevent-host-death family antitoxin [Actinomycetota bacterium]|nr:type II toxin-antitoxin system prevent-host-death family antitoxin [Actinomycetota bacterium]
MDTVSVRDLRNHGGEVLTRVAQGEPVVITRDGAPVAELRPLRRRALLAAELIARRASIPDMNPEQLRTDVDAVIDQSL